MPAERVCTIEGSADPATGRPICLITWGTITRAPISTEQAFVTARELAAAAVAAETDKALVEELTSRTGAGLDLQSAGVLLGKVRERRTTMHTPGVRPALRIEALYGAKTKLPLVHIGRGSMSGELSPDEARQMAQHWTETTLSSILDARTRYTLAEFGFDKARTEEFFTTMLDLHR